jgi:hypothetical protein
MNQDENCQNKRGGVYFGREQKNVEPEFHCHMEAAFEQRQHGALRAPISCNLKRKLVMRQILGWRSTLSSIWTFFIVHSKAGKFVTFSSL